MSDPDAVSNLVGAVEADVAPLLRRVVGELGLDDGPTLAALGSMFSEAWVAGARAARHDDAVRAAAGADLKVSEDATRAIVESARPALTADEVIRALARVTARHGDSRRGATRQEIADELQVPVGDVSREGRDPDGPLGRALARGLVAAHPRYPGYWLLTVVGEAHLRR